MITESTSQKITDRIIKALEDGTVPWRKTWKSYRSYNIISGNHYNGANALFTHPMITGFKSPVFMTYIQCTSLGGAVIKGSKGIPITRPVMRKCKKTGNETPSLMRYHVFNHEQTEGVDLDEEDKWGNDLKEIPSADELVDSIKAVDIQYGNYNPCYNPSLDTIFMPERESFESSEAFHETRFHELGHWTGHEKRLNRDMKPLMFDKHSYSKEELVAELTSAFCCHHVGIETESENQAAYCASWLQALGNDRRFIIEAAAKADQAFKLIIGDKHD